jgi:hypothetical protein
MREERGVTVRCHACGAETAAERIAMRAVCGCGAWLHCCRNCDFYAPGRANDCREPRVERVADKEAGNFCDWFRPATTAPPADRPAANARAALDALFGKKPS